MIYNRFRINCVLRILLLSVTTFIWFYLYFNTEFYMSMLICGILALYQIYALIHYVEKTDRDLTRFLFSIKHADFSESFISGGNSPAA